MTRCLQARPRWLSRGGFKDRERERGEKKEIYIYFCLITSWKDFPVSLINVTETSRPTHEITFWLAWIWMWLIDWVVMKMRRIPYWLDWKWKWVGRYFLLSYWKKNIGWSRHSMIILGTTLSYKASYLYFLLLLLLCERRVGSVYRTVQTH